ncbi:MAG: hypothetical protein IPJ89_00900 [Candidatus Iainarchaeum archaeon]|uniref:CARDB domain-containing protein n=1 Tax=Candidatus Iainarchaeum sp. TaxID=3101447 RepID=A0A7T9DK49_9ARCH|nr:MAG: hypothetical protein IPJ89_00900 [Candidatus Diapherotrites archaeon]
MNKLLLVFLGVLFFAVAVHAQSLTVSSVNIDPSPAVPGSYVTITAFIANSSQLPVPNAQAVLTLRGDGAATDFPFSLDPQDSPVRDLGTVPGFQTVTVKYNVQVDAAALDGAYPVSIQVGPAGKPGGKLEFVINVIARQPILAVVSSTPTSVGVGQSSELSLQVKNIGSSTAQDVTIGVGEDRTVTSTGAVVERDIFPLGAAFAYLPRLSPGEMVMIHLPILVNPSATSKPYFVPITMSFYDSNKTNYASTDYVGLKVVAEAQLGVSVSKYDTAPTPGNAAAITIDMFNTGLGAAKLLEVHAEADWMDLSKKDFFIGTIESDDFDSITLEGKVSPDASPGLHDAVITLVFQNAFGDEQTVERTVPVRVFSPSELAQQNGDGFPLPLVIAVIVIIVGVWYFRFRKPTNGKAK